MRNLATRARGFFNKAVNTLSDGPAVHNTIEDLLTQSKILLAKQKDTMPEAAVGAANSMHRELRKLLDDDSKNTMKGLMVEFTLLSNAVDIISKYEKQLEVAPGFWNQFKSYVNDAVEVLTGVKSFLDVEKTAFGSQVKGAEYQALKDGLKAMKNDPNEIAAALTSTGFSSGK